MKQLLGSFILLFVPLVAAIGQETPQGTSTVTFGVGGAWPFRNYLGGGPAFNGTYEYRLFKHWALEVGVDTTIVRTPSYSSGAIYSSTCTPTVCTTNYSGYFSSYATQADRVTTVPFGPRWILPVRNGRAEFWFGAGGAHMWAPQGFTFPASAFGIEGNMGARIAADKNRHFWLGTTGRYLHDFNTSPRQWMTWTADVGFRFGK